MQHVSHIVYMHNILSPPTAAPRLLGKILRGLNIARIRKGTIEARTLLLGHWALYAKAGEVARFQRC
jgi:hypothetical protein